MSASTIPTGSGKSGLSDSWDRPVRPMHLRGQILSLHALLIAVMVFFAFFATELSPSVHLIVLATITVTLGCKHSNFFYCLLAEDDPDSEEPGAGVDNEDLGPVIGSDEAARMPIMGSCVLFGLFCVYKYLPGDYVKLLFTLYVVCMCMGGLGVNLSDLVNLIRNRTTKPFIDLKAFSILGIAVGDVSLTFVDVLGYALAAALGYYYVLTRDDYEANWIVNNLFGVSFCLLGMKHVNISTYKTGAIMLCGLFVYDVFWVFLSKPLIGTNVMVHVAKGVKAPIKLMFPRIGTGMIATEGDDGAMWPAERTVLAHDAANVTTEYNTSELIGCKLTCIHSDPCNFMSWDNATAADASCSLYSAAGETMVAAAHAGVAWFSKGDKFQPSMLGLGDIVVPGIFLSLLGKWDTARHFRANVAKYGLEDAERHPVGYSTYFNWSMIAYVLSLIATLIAMIYMDAAQPALLYIVPFVLGASMLVALIRGEMTELWEFEVPGAEENEGPIADMVETLTDDEGNVKRRLTKADVAELRKLLDTIIPDDDDEASSSKDGTANGEKKKDQ
eukprot:g1278.t1